jgi:hypothetical protein
LPTNEHRDLAHFMRHPELSADNGDDHQQLDQRKSDTRRLKRAAEVF